ncbi:MULTISPECIES: hypothetical protein [Pedobacter]|uniref:hypothetical protein n=1 Tax=Pedobacter TaxID=84567 RepID=UPI001217D100|nr:MULTISPECIES: hypothetical protein [Pedobacter]RZL51318.1 MAG: hypothetical protein EOO93_23465 [Pedobacter sp.]
MRNEKLNLLQPFVGNWVTNGQTADDKNIVGTDIYKWIDGGFFMVHNVDIQIGNEHISSVEIIHYDNLEDVFRTQSFGSDGLISISTIKIYDDIILIFADHQRFQGKFLKNKIVGIWEHRVKDEWQHLMNIQLTKQ